MDSNPIAPAAFRATARGFGYGAVTAGLLACGLLLADAPAHPAAAQANPRASVAIPGFWDAKRRPERPDLSRLNGIRFLTEVDYPPFNYAGPDGNPAGFNVDLARMICEEIKVQCTIQMRRFDTLLNAVTG